MKGLSYSGRRIAADLFNPDCFRLAETFGAWGVRVGDVSARLDAVRTAWKNVSRTDGD